METTILSNNLKTRIHSGILMFALAVFLISSGGFFYTSALILIACFCTAEFFLIIAPSVKDNLKINRIIFRGVLWIAIPLISLYIMREVFSKGVIISFWFFVSIALVDTFAYFTGRLIGKNKIAPNISPSKTVEGFIGGVLFSTFFSIFFYYIFKSDLPLWGFILFSCVLSILAQISDLIESRFKRKFNVKDSSNIIPGHGGFLDRLDGYAITAPFVVITYCFLKYSFGLSLFI
jgi:CDP-diglyceride synthetase